MKEKLELMRAPFPDHLIGKLPKPTKRQTDEVKANYKVGVRCAECGGWHHPKVVHLDYVGHAALTDRFLDADPAWSWEPLALADSGLPLLDGEGLLWIKLTLCGVTRLGVGDAGAKSGGDAMKERIGDALRNAGMRFGAALDLWHKGDLHTVTAKDYEDSLNNCIAIEELSKAWEAIPSSEREGLESAKDRMKAVLIGTEKISEEQVKQIKDGLVDLAVDNDAFMGYLKKNRCNSIEEINNGFFQQVVDMLAFSRNGVENELK